MSRIAQKEDLSDPDVIAQAGGAADAGPARDAARRRRDAVEDAGPERPGDAGVLTGDATAVRLVE